MILALAKVLQAPGASHIDKGRKKTTRLEIELSFSSLVVFALCGQYG